MRIAVVQQHAGQDKQENVARGLRAFEAAARGGAQVVGFAELAFERFYPQNPAGPESLREAETVPGPMTDAFAAKARELGVVFVLNLYERDGARTYDCSPVIDADGTLLGRTRMIHITEYACFHETGLLHAGRHRRAGLRHEGRAASAWRSATTATIPSTCARSPLPARISSSCRRRARSASGPTASTKRRCASPRSRTATTSRSAIASGKEECLTFAGESFVCVAGRHRSSRARRAMTDAILYADIDYARNAESHARRLFLRHRRPELYAAWLAR